MPENPTSKRSYTTGKLEREREIAVIVLFQDSLRREKKIKQKQQFVHVRTSSFVIVETCADRVQNYPGALEYFYGRARSVVLPFWNDLLLPGV